MLKVGILKLTKGLLQAGVTIGTTIDMSIGRHVRIVDFDTVKLVDL